MNEHEDQADSAALGPLERLLERFEVVGPPVALRQRVLDAAVGAGQGVGRRRVALWAWRAAVAAGLAAAVWLNLAGDRIATQLAGRVGIGAAVWTEQAEQAAELLDGEGWGRRYLALALRAGPLEGRVAPTPEAIEEALPEPTR